MRRLSFSRLAARRGRVPARGPLTKKRCAALHEVLDSPPAILRMPDASAFVDSFTGVEGCIVDGLLSSSAVEDWGRFEQYVFAATRHPDGRYVPVLCSVLRRRLFDVNNEDVVSALDEIADPASVPCLVEAMWWERDRDEFWQLARKCIWALGRIGDAEALEALRDAASVGSEVVREYAEAELSRRP